MPKDTKYEYVLVIQNKQPGCGWEDETEYNRSDRKDMLYDLKQYRFSGQGLYRCISRRVLRQEAVNDSQDV